MKLQEYFHVNNVEESVIEKVQKEFKAMTLVDMERYSDEIQNKCKRRMEELTLTKVIDSFFKETNGKEGAMFEIVCNFGLVPKYIDIYRFGKQFILRKDEEKIIGCFYRAT